MNLESKIAGALYGVAIGDAMGAPVEGHSPARILERFAAHDFRTFLPPTHDGDPAMGKGNGRITDDTLMTEALIRAYMDAADHLDAYGYAQYLLPWIADRPVWVPERQAEMPLIHRLWHPEKYPWMRLMSNVDPRSAGVGNCVNCGVAMWMMPAGAIHAGDPRAAYQEAAAIGSAHNESFAVEAGAVMAAAYAAAFATGSRQESVLAAACDLARDGTARAVAAAVDAAHPNQSAAEFVAKVRAAVAPYDQRTGHVDDSTPLRMGDVSDTGRPSRLASIEELPVALAALKHGGGDAVKTLKAGVLYGRDCDSIAGMALGLHGALYGVETIPAGLREAVDLANRRSFGELALKFALTVKTVFGKDEARFDAHRRSVRI
jgi:ADP-ribosylglycohydrolase